MNILNLWDQRPPGRKPAQALLEFALVLPILLLIIFGIIEFSRLFYAWITIENSARFGIRYATTGNYEIAHCADLDGDGTLCGGVSEDLEIDAARVPSIKDEARGMIIGLHYNEALSQAEIDYLKLTVCSSRLTEDGQSRVFIVPQMARPVYSDCQPGEDAGLPGQTVVVSADYNFTFIVLPIFGFEPMLHLASYREGIVEQFRVSRDVVPPGELALVPGEPPPPINTSEPSSTPPPTNTPPPTETPTLAVTNTPTMTFTPSPTPVPSCSNLTITGVRFTGDDFEVRVRNRNVAPAFLISSTLEWNTSFAPPMFFNQAAFGTTYYTNDHTNSPISMPAPALMLPGNSARWWRADFDNPTFQGRYGATLTFDFPNWGTCTLTTSIIYTTPTPSRTPMPRTPTTPAPTRTPGPTQIGTSAPPPTVGPINTPTRAPTSVAPTQAPTSGPPAPPPTFCPDC